MKEMFSKLLVSIIIIFLIFITLLIFIFPILYVRAEEISVTATVPEHTVPTIVGKVQNNYGSQVETYNPQSVGLNVSSGL